jgi:hypothetical protein
MINHLLLARLDSVNFGTVKNACRGPNLSRLRIILFVNRRANQQRRAVAVAKSTSRALVTRTNIAIITTYEELRDEDYIV